MPKPDQKAVEARYVKMLADVPRDPLAHAKADALLLAALKALGHEDLALAYICCERRQASKFICS